MPSRRHEGPRTVCHLRASNFFGGPEKQILEHCLSLDPARWRPVVASFHERTGTAALIEESRRRGIPTLELAGAHGWSPAPVLSLRKQLAARRIDILVTHGYKPDVVGALSTTRGTARQISFQRGFTGEDVKVRAYERLDRWVSRHMPLVVCVSAALAEDLRNHGIPGDRLAVVRNAIRSTPIYPTDLRKELGLGQETPLLLAVGRLSPEKGHAVLVHALARVLNQRPRVHVALLGEGIERDALMRAAAGLGIAARVHFLGFRTDVLGCLATATAFVNPSHTEGLPNAMLEAALAGAPVIATRVGGVPEALDHDRHAVLVEPGDPQALAAGILRVLENPEAALARAARAQDHIRTRFTFEGQATRLMDIYDQAVVEGSRKRG